MQRDILRIIICQERIGWGKQSGNIIHRKVDVTQLNIKFLWKLGKHIYWHCSSNFKPILAEVLYRPPSSGGFSECLESALKNWKLMLLTIKRYTKCHAGYFNEKSIWGHQFMGSSILGPPPPQPYLLQKWTIDLLFKKQQKPQRFDKFKTPTTFPSTWTS